MDKKNGKGRVASSQIRVRSHHVSAGNLAQLVKVQSSKNLLIRSHLLSGHQASVYTAKPSTRRSIVQAAGVFGTKIGSLKRVMLISPHASLGDLSMPAHARERSLTLKRCDSQVMTIETTRLHAPIATQPKHPLPLPPHEVLASYADELTQFECEEVDAYESIYYLGDPSSKRKEAAFDSDQGDYVIKFGEHLAFRYEVLDQLGKGSFGIVVKCFDHKRKEEVAIKIIKNKKLFHQQGAVEVKVLQTMRENNKDAKVPVVTIKASFVFRKHLCIVFEMLSRSLYEFMKINRFHGLPMTLIRKFALQILRALAFTRHLRIIHCDLKPENILLKHDNKASLKIIDFGSACFDHAKVYTYIQSRFYRSPEIILGIGYTTAIDMWSFGCILIELAIGIPAFPGENERDQLGLFMEVLGVPPPSLITHSPKKLVYFDPNFAPKVSPDSKGRIHYPSSKSLEDFIGVKDPHFLHIVQRCLDWNPATRLTPEEALAHPWITDPGAIPTNLQRKNKSQSMSTLPTSSRRHRDFAAIGH